MSKIDLNALSEEDVKALQEQLKQRERDKQLELQQKRRAYESEKDKLVEDFVTRARHVSNEIAQLKSDAIQAFEEFRLKMLEYGDLRGGEKNKGSFQLRDSSDQFQVSVRNAVSKAFDERAELAEQHLKQFLESFVRKRDTKLYKMIMTLLERNEKTGKLDISNIQRIYKMEHDFDDENWLKAVQLFKEAYQERTQKTYIQFSVKTEQDHEWTPILLAFSSI